MDDRLEQISTCSKWIVATVLGIWSALPQLTQLLVWLMVIDIALGLAVGWKNKNLSTDKAVAGTTKKIARLLLVAVCALLNPIVNSVIEVNLVQASSAFYIVPELLSIVRNAALLNVQAPGQLDLVLKYFQAVGGRKDDNNANKPLP